VKPADLAQLFATEGPRLLRKLRRFRGRVAEEDVVQSAFTKMLEMDMSGIADPRAYLARLVRNLAVDEVRRQDRLRVAAVTDDELAELLAKRLGPYDRLDLTPEDMLIAGERFAHMTGVVLNLPERERKALVLFKFGGLSHEEIAAKLGVARHSVPRLLARALAKCAKAMAAFEDGALKEIAHDMETKREDR